MRYSYAQTPRRQVKVMELKEGFQFVSPKVREAMELVVAYLENMLRIYGRCLSNW